MYSVDISQTPTCNAAGKFNRSNHYLQCTWITIQLIFVTLTALRDTLKS